jgi:hypothetical protein
VVVLSFQQSWRQRDGAEVLTWLFREASTGDAPRGRQHVKLGPGWLPGDRMQVDPIDHPEELDWLLPGLLVCWSADFGQDEPPDPKDCYFRFDALVVARASREGLS